MENSLLKIFRREKVKQIRFGVLLAILVSASVLAASFVAFNLLDDNNQGTDIDGDPNPNPNPNEPDFVLSLNSYMDQQYIGGKVSAFLIHGNATASIHPSLISSIVVPSGTDWGVNAYVVVGGDPFNVEEVTFSFTDSEMGEAHQAFLSSLADTSEAEKPDWTDLPSAQMAISYTVLYQDGTGLEFLWLGFEDLDILGVQNVTWGGSVVTTTTAAHLSQSDTDYNFSTVGEEMKYIDPLSAFDGFIDKLQELYTPHLEA